MKNALLSNHSALSILGGSVPKFLKYGLPITSTSFLHLVLGVCSSKYFTVTVSNNNRVKKRPQIMILASIKHIIFH